MDKYIERVYKKYNKKGIEDDGCVMSKEGRQFGSYLKRQMKASAEERSFCLHSFTVGHYYISGFFQKDEKYVYFSYDIPRGGTAMDFDHHDAHAGFLYRRAKHGKDYRGEENHFSSLPKLMDNIEKLFG